MVEFQARVTCSHVKSLNINRSPTHDLGVFAMHIQESGSLFH